MNLRYLTCLMAVLNVSLSAQELSGIVSDDYQEPIPSVSVFNKTTSLYTYSDDLGNFTFDEVSIGDTLQFMHIGFTTMTLEVTDVQTPMMVVLTTNIVSLNEMIISPKRDPLKQITDIDIEISPVNSSQDILRKVPGLFIGQHAGGGKAEQLFLRGFDIDHGTDISISVDGLPVNMVSHAHGQGYADLHFVIPETIEKIDFGIGSYYENKGNFNTAGYVNFMTKRKLDDSSLKLEAGMFDTYRVLGMIDVLDKNNHDAYVATEYLISDGPFESPQNFDRLNVFGKYTGFVSDTDRVGVTASTFSSSWDASGQIPERAVQSGSITRFGAIDDTEGGYTSRTNLLLTYDKFINNETSLKSSLYLSRYDFELYSNFTFFLEDPVNGDQIRQKEDRTIYGFNSELQKSFSTQAVDGTWIAGIQLRKDLSLDNELSRTLNRVDILERIQLGDINETNIAAYLGTTIDIDKWTINPSIRLDYFDFQYENALLSTITASSQAKSTISPKLNVFYTQSEQLQLYAKAGKGFHSNDTRVVVAQEGREILPAAYSFDVGLTWKPTSTMFLNLTSWQLFLEQEFVYVGDAGIVEPSGRTRRQGIDLSYRYQPLPWLYWSLDANYTYARSTEEPEGQNFIPLAPDFTLVSGININHSSGFYGGLNIRYLDNRSANEDNSLVAEGYTVADLNMGYKFDKMSVGFQIQNLFDTEWNETQFATESRLFEEIQPVEEIHFTPGAPFFIKVILQYSF